MFIHLRELELKGCYQVEAASLVAVLVSCTQLRINVGEFLLTHGRVEEALGHWMQESKEAQQSG